MGLILFVNKTEIFFITTRDYIVLFAIYQIKILPFINKNDKLHISEFHRSIKMNNGK